MHDPVELPEGAEWAPFSSNEVLKAQWSGGPLTIKKYAEPIRLSDDAPVVILCYATRRLGNGNDLMRTTAGYARKLEAARQRMNDIYLDAPVETGMQSVIAQAADAEGVQREDLCLYLMCLGLMNQQRMAW